MYVVRESNEQDDGSTYTEFNTYEEAKRYFDESVDSVIKEWQKEGMDDELIREQVDDCVTETEVKDWGWEMKIVKI